VLRKAREDQRLKVSLVVSRAASAGSLIVFTSMHVTIAEPSRFERRHAFGRLLDIGKVPPLT